MWDAQGFLWLEITKSPFISQSSVCKKIGLPFYRPSLSAAFKCIPQPFIWINLGSESDPVHWLPFRIYWWCSGSPTVEPWELMGLSKWLISPHSGIFQYDSMIYSHCKTNLVLVKWAALTSLVWLTIALLYPQKMWKEQILLYGWNLCCDTGYHFIGYSDPSFCTKPDSWRGGPVLGNLWPQWDLEARLCYFQERETMVLDSSLHVFSIIPVSLPSISGTKAYTQ